MKNFEFFVLSDSIMRHSHQIGRNSVCQEERTSLDNRLLIREKNF